LDAFFVAVAAASNFKTLEAKSYWKIHIGNLNQKMSNCNYENYEIYSIFQKQILVQKFVQSGTIRYKLG